MRGVRKTNKQVKPQRAADLGGISAVRRRVNDPL
jgi:hypothetical protein